MTKKQSKKLARSGQLKKKIQARHKQKSIQNRVQAKQQKKQQNPAARSSHKSEGDSRVRPARSREPADSDEDEDLMDAVDDQDDSVSQPDDNDTGADGSEQDSDGDDDESDGDASFAELDDLDEAGGHKLELEQLAKKDPEFFEYLTKNDPELLDFDPTAAPAVDSDQEDADMAEDSEEDGEESQSAPVLMIDALRKWQKSLLEHRSLAAFRKLQVAFRAAAHMNEEDVQLAWTIDNGEVFNKVVTTTLRYTPVVLEHHMPYKQMPNDKFKPPVQTAKQQQLQRVIHSYIQNVLHLVEQSPDHNTVLLACKETAKVVPYFVSSRKTVKVYLKGMLQLWATAEDNIRVAAFLAIRRLSQSSDESIIEQVLKGLYLGLVRASKTTTVHTLPAINLMKNSASEIYCTHLGAAYIHAFGYIRQLATHLRNSMKTKSKDSHKLVYNWQFIHSVDFWCLLLARASELDKSGVENNVQPLIYPLVQVILGSISLVPNPRSFPLHLQLMRSLLRLIQQTKIYIPFLPSIVPILNSALSSSSKPKSSMLPPLDLDLCITAPAPYARTRVYAEVLADEVVFVLAEWSHCALNSIAFPELVFPIVTGLRKIVKGTKAQHKGVISVKILVEKLEASAAWSSGKRDNVEFGPGKRDHVHRWENDLEVKTAPLDVWLRTLRRTREKQKKAAAVAAATASSKKNGDVDAEDSD
ncbi:Noc2-domain-containing protein [Auriculariales sp. MPI-PUGE-AT-0066]|nr:Noc2-domain-containing protein [Auriculariales sp. MPI-PUGE-AT-0066]